MTHAVVFLVATVAGAAALALWLDARFGRLAPAGMAARLAAVIAAGLLLQVAGVAFAALLDSSLAPALRALGGLGVLLPALMLSFLSANWLLRSLTELGGAR